MPSTIRLHRVLKAPPERVYRAFLDPAAMCKWLPPYGFTCTVHQADAKVGGSHKASFTNFTTGKSHSFGGRYLELKPNEAGSYMNLGITYQNMGDTIKAKEYLNKAFEMNPALRPK